MYICVCVPGLHIEFFFAGGGGGGGESGTSCVRILSSPHTLMHTLAKDYIATCTYFFTLVNWSHALNSSVFNWNIWDNL